MGRLDLAFETFFTQRTEQTNNDITFGCLIDACIRNDNIQKAEETFN
jgi:hypothetical protein